MYGYLGHDALTNVGLDAFVAYDHVHELHDIVMGLFVPGHDSDTPMASIEKELLDHSIESDVDDENEEAETLDDEDDVDFHISSRARDGHAYSCG